MHIVQVSLKFIIDHKMQLVANLAGPSNRYILVDYHRHLGITHITCIYQTLLVLSADKYSQVIRIFDMFTFCIKRYLISLEIIS